jgi:3-oxoacyl-[acyl-carrier-protein] synthase-3
MQSSVAGIEYYLPENVLSTSDLAEEFPEWSVEKIDAKTGIRERHIASADERSSDLAVGAARKLFDSGACTPESVDFVLLCTQTPDYFLPTTACLLQDRLGIPTSAGALDFNLGCSGYIYGLGLAHGLISSGQASNVLLITAETYSKFIHPRDRSVRTIFGDAAAATIVRAVESDVPLIGPFVFGSDGRGAGNLIVPVGGMRRPRSQESDGATEDETGNVRSEGNLLMNGPEIFTFTLAVVPQCIERLFARSGLTMDNIDLFVFHQANQYMLEHLRNRMDIPEEKFFVRMSHSGNTVASTIPIALKHASCEGRLKRGSMVMLVGFGVGYSWGATLLRWR